MITIWEAMLAEPRWIAIIGLVLDAVGAVLVAFTAWLRISAVSYIGYGGGPNIEEERSGLINRRRLVVVGAFLLVAGFILQGIAAWLQMGRGHPGYWTI